MGGIVGNVRRDGVCLLLVCAKELSHSLPIERKGVSTWLSVDETMAWETWSSVAEASAVDIAEEGDDEVDDEGDEKVVAEETSDAIGGGNGVVNENLLRLRVLRVLALSFNSLITCIASIAFLVFSSTRSDVLLVSRLSLIVLVFLFMLFTSCCDCDCDCNSICSISSFSRREEE